MLCTCRSLAGTQIELFVAKNPKAYHYVNAQSTCNMEGAAYSPLSNSNCNISIMDVKRT